MSTIRPSIRKFLRAFSALLAAECRVLPNGIIRGRRGRCPIEAVAYAKGGRRGSAFTDEYIALAGLNETEAGIVIDAADGTGWRFTSARHVKEIAAVRKAMLRAVEGARKSRLETQ